MENADIVDGVFDRNGRLCPDYLLSNSTSEEKKMNKTILIGIVIASCIVLSSLYVIFSLDTNVRDKTLVVGTYWQNGENYQITNEFIAIFTDHSMYKISFDTCTNNSYNSDTIILEGENNTLTKNEIRGLLYILNNTIPNNTYFSRHGYIVYVSEKAVISAEEFDALTTLIENNGFNSLNETYNDTTEYPEPMAGYIWITVNYNNSIKKVVCYNSDPNSFREIWDMVENLESDKWGVN